MKTAAVYSYFFVWLEVMLASGKSVPNYQVQMDGRKFLFWIFDSRSDATDYARESGMAGSIGGIEPINFSFVPDDDAWMEAAAFHVRRVLDFEKKEAAKR